MAMHEAALLIRHSLESLGRAVDYQVTQLFKDAINIVLGYQILDDVSQIRDCKFIIYQLEQLSDQEG
jgi:hypothetical protein